MGVLGLDQVELEWEEGSEKGSEEGSEEGSWNPGEVMWMLNCPGRGLRRRLCRDWRQSLQVDTGTGKEAVGFPELDQ